MACCGQKRIQIALRNIPVRQEISRAAPAYFERSQPQAQAPIVAFQYTGRSALTAIGLISGRQYRFAHPGAVLQVDPRDRASLGTVPHLRQV